MVDGEFGKAAIGGKPVGTVALVVVPVILAVIQAGRVHPLAAALALPAAGVDLDRDPLPDPETVHPGAQCGDGSHIFVAGREPGIEGQSASDPRRGSMRYD